MKRNEELTHYHMQNQIFAKIVCEVALLFYELLFGEGGKCGSKE